MKEHQILSQIAAQHLGVTTLERQDWDGRDFHELAVWQISAALLAAYQAGQDSAKTGSK